jgi:hypothetical protein
VNNSPTIGHKGELSAYSRVGFYVLWRVGIKGRVPLRFFVVEKWGSSKVTHEKSPLNKLLNISP